MFTHYGWLMVYGHIDDPAVGKHGGDVYVHKDDVADGEMLRPGDIVTFFLSKDDKGLGAEECRIEQAGGALLNRDAAEHVPKYGSTRDEHADNGPYNDGSWKLGCVDGLFLRLSHAFVPDDEDDAVEEHHSAIPWKTKQSPSLDGSTDDGGVTDSDDELSWVAPSDSEDESICPAEIMKAMPLGETLPPHFRPPPGLDLLPTCSDSRTAGRFCIKKIRM
jgi:cold shock CspA family protein